MAINQVTFEGHTGKAFVVKNNAKGTPYATGSFCVRLASTLDKTTREWDNEGLWLNIQCLGYLAEKAAKIPKGSHIVVTGRLRNWHGPESKVEPNQADFLKIDAVSIDILGVIPKPDEPKPNKKSSGRTVNPPEPTDDDGAL